MVAPPGGLVTTDVKTIIQAKPNTCQDCKPGCNIQNYIVNLCHSEPDLPSYDGSNPVDLRVRKKCDNQDLTTTRSDVTNIHVYQYYVHQESRQFIIMV